MSSDSPVKKVKIDDTAETTAKFRMDNENSSLLILNEDDSLEIEQDDGEKSDYYSIFGLLFKRTKPFDSYQIIEKEDDGSKKFLFTARAPIIRLTTSSNKAFGPEKLKTHLLSFMKGKSKSKEAEDIRIRFKTWCGSRKRHTNKIRDHLLDNLERGGIDSFNRAVDDIEGYSNKFTEDTVTIFKELIENEAKVSLTMANSIANNALSEDDKFQKFLCATIKDYGSESKIEESGNLDSPSGLGMYMSQSPCIESQVPLTSSNASKALNPDFVSQIFGNSKEMEVEEEIGNFAEDFGIEDLMFPGDNGKSDSTHPDLLGLGKQKHDHEDPVPKLSGDALTAVDCFLKSKLDRFDPATAEYSTMQGLIKRLGQQESVSKEGKRQLSLIDPTASIQNICFELLCSMVVNSMKKKTEMVDFDSFLEILFNNCSELIGKVALSVAANGSDIHLMQCIAKDGKVLPDSVNKFEGKEKYHAATATAIIQASGRTLTREGFGLGIDGLQTKKLKQALKSEYSFKDKVPFQLDHELDKINIKGYENVEEATGEPDEIDYFGMTQLWK